MFECIQGFEKSFWTSLVEILYVYVYSKKLCLVYFLFFNLLVKLIFMVNSYRRERDGREL